MTVTARIWLPNLVALMQPTLDAVQYSMGSAGQNVEHLSVHKAAGRTHGSKSRTSDILYIRFRFWAMRACIVDSLSRDGDGSPFALAHVMLEFGRQDQEAGHGTYAASLISEYTNTHNSLLNLTARTFTATMPGDIHYRIWQVLQLVPSPAVCSLCLSSACCCSSTGGDTVGVSGHQ